MAQITSEVLTADGMSVTIFASGRTVVGIGITNTFVGTLKFYGSVDGVNFLPISATPFPSGAGVLSVTATGNWFVNVLNYVAIKVVFSRTSGSATVRLAAASDASWQDAFLSSSTVANSSAVSSGTNTLTQTAQANRAWKLTFCEVSFGGNIVGSSQRIDIYDGTISGTKLYTAFLNNNTGSVGSVQKINIPVDASGNPSLVTTPGNAMTIVVSGSNLPQSVINSNFTAA